MRRLSQSSKPGRANCTDCIPQTGSLHSGSARATSRSAVGFLIGAVEAGRVPGALVRVGIRRLLKARLRETRTRNNGHSVDDFLRATRAQPIAVTPQRANQQHYELPTAFFQHVLGARLKYSSCYWADDVTSLNQAEEAALRITCRNAALANDMDVLELGCGWGSLSLWMAEQYPDSRITSVSNSGSQREFIQNRAAELGLSNLSVITADMNDFQPAGSFDRVVSVEMFEHMRNYQELLGRVSNWLKPGGKLFVHIFCHRTVAYPFEVEGKSDWMAQHFFTGGIMPSASLLAHFQRDVQLEQQWHWNGRHYEKTSNAWLSKMDQNCDTIMAAFDSTYGKDAARWFGRWRIFHMACAELFGYNDGEEWFVTHMRFGRR